MIGRCCENCRFWHQGDITPKGIGNVGHCAALMPRTGGFYDRNRTTPFWAQKLSGQTASYDGEQSNAFHAKKGDAK